MIRESVLRFFGKITRKRGQTRSQSAKMIYLEIVSLWVLANPSQGQHVANRCASSACVWTGFLKRSIFQRLKLESSGKSSKQATTTPRGPLRNTRQRGTAGE